MITTFKVPGKQRAAQKTKRKSGGRGYSRNNSTVSANTFPDENKNSQLFMQMDQYGPLPVTQKGFDNQFLNTPQLGQQERPPRPMAHPLTELHVNRIDFTTQTNIPRTKNVSNTRNRAPSLNFEQVHKPHPKFDYSSLVERRSSMASLSSANQLEPTELSNISLLVRGQLKQQEVPKEPSKLKQKPAKTKKQLAAPVREMQRSMSMTNKYIKTAYERQRQIDARLQVPVLMQRKIGLFGSTTGRTSHLSSSRSTRQYDTVSVGEGLEKEKIGFSRNSGDLHSNLYENSQNLNLTQNIQEQVGNNRMFREERNRSSRAVSEHFRTEKGHHQRTTAVLQNPLTIDSLENGSEPPTGRFVSTRRQQSLASQQSVGQAPQINSKAGSNQLPENEMTDEKSDLMELEDQIENNLKYTDINSLLSPPQHLIYQEKQVQQQRRSKKARTNEAKKRQKQRPISAPMYPKKKENLLTLPKVQQQFSPTSPLSDMQPMNKHQKGFSFTQRPFTTLQTFQKNQRTFKNIMSTSPNLIKGLLSPKTPQMQPTRPLSSKSGDTQYLAAPPVSYIRQTASSRARAASTRAATLASHIQKLKLYLYSGAAPTNRRSESSRGPLSSKSGHSKTNPSDRSPLLTSNQSSKMNKNTGNRSNNITSSQSNQGKKLKMKSTSNMQSSASNALGGGTSPNAVSQFDPHQLKIQTKQKVQNKQKLRKAARIAAKRIDMYKTQVTMESVRQFARGQQPTTAYFKAGRCLCLLMKALTGMDEERNRQVKDDEIFKQWDKVCQYLNSDQGAYQISLFPNLTKFCGQAENRQQKIDKETLLSVLRREIFGYTLMDLSDASPDELPAQKALNGLDLSSPRVKNEPVKPYFALAYFVMVFVAIHEAIDEIEQLEDQQHKHDETADNTTFITQQEQRRSTNTTGIEDESMFNQIMNESIETKHNKSIRLQNLNKAYQSCTSSIQSGKQLQIDSEAETDLTNKSKHAKPRSIASSNKTNKSAKTRKSRQEKVVTAVREAVAQDHSAPQGPGPAAAKKESTLNNTLDQAQMAIQCATCDMFSSQVKMGDECVGSSSEYKRQPQQMNMLLGSNRNKEREQRSQPSQSAGLDLSDVYEEGYNQRDLAQRSKVAQRQFKGLDNIEISELDLGIANDSKKVVTEKEKKSKDRPLTDDDDTRVTLLSTIEAASQEAGADSKSEGVQGQRKCRLTLNEAASAAHIGSHHSMSTSSQQNNFSSSQEQKTNIQLHIELGQPARPNSLQSSNKNETCLLMQRGEVSTNHETNEAGIPNHFTDSIMTVASNLQNQQETQDNIQEPTDATFKGRSPLQSVQVSEINAAKAVTQSIVEDDQQAAHSSTSEFTFHSKSDSIGAGLMTVPQPLNHRIDQFYPLNQAKNLDTPPKETPLQLSLGPRSFQTSPHHIQPNTVQSEEATTLLVQTINSCAKKGEQVRVEDLLRKINKEERLSATQQPEVEHYTEPNVLYESLASTSCLSNALQKKRASLEKAFMEFYREGQEESPAKVVNSLEESGRQQFANTGGQSPGRVEVLNLYEAKKGLALQQETASDCGTPMQQKFVSPEIVEASPITQILMRRLPSQYPPSQNAQQSTHVPQIMTGFQLMKDIETEESEPKIMMTLENLSPASGGVIGAGLLALGSGSQKNKDLFAGHSPLSAGREGDLLIDKLKQKRSVSCERKTGADLDSEVERILAEARRLTAPAEKEDGWKRFIQNRPVYQNNQ